MVPRLRIRAFRPRPGKRLVSSELAPSERPMEKRSNTRAKCPSTRTRLLHAFESKAERATANPNTNDPISKATCIILSRRRHTAQTIPFLAPISCFLPEKVRGVAGECRTRREYGLYSKLGG